MAKYEARVRTRFGEIVVNFDNLEELKSNLDALDASTALEIVRKKFEPFVVTETRKPKPGFEKSTASRQAILLNPLTFLMT
jgi:hypothetical protein